MNVISSDKLEEFKNGALGVTRNGLRARFIHQENKGSCTVVAVFWNDGIQLQRYSALPYYYLNDNNDLDIVGLWEDKPEPFDLERALAGEPVLLKSGEKAFVLNNIEPLMYSNYPLIGVDNNGEPLHWDKTGICGSRGLGGELNIIGMWKDPVPFKPSADDLPKPIRDFGDLEEVWYVELDAHKNIYDPNNSIKGDHWSNWQYARLNNGFYYATKKDCQKVCNWLMGR